MPGRVTMAKPRRKYSAPLTGLFRRRRGGGAAAVGGIDGLSASLTIAFRLTGILSTST